MDGVPYPISGWGSVKLKLPGGMSLRGAPIPASTGASADEGRRSLRPAARSQLGLICLGVATLPLLLVGLIPLGVAWDRLRCRYAVGGDRVTRETPGLGVLGEGRTETLPTDAIDEVTVEQGPVARRLGVGTVVVRGEAGTEIRLEGVADPDRVRCRIEAARDGASPPGQR